MSKNRSLMVKVRRIDKKAKAGLFYLFGNMFNSAISFLVMPIFTRLLTTEEYGLASTYLSLVSIISTFIALNLGNTVRNAFVDYKESLNEYISTVFVTGLISSGFFTIVFFALNHYIGLIQPEYLVLMCCVQACMSGFIGTVAMRYMMSGDYIKRTFLLVAPNLIVTIVSVIVILTVPGDRFIERVTVYFFVYTIIGLVLAISQIIKSKRKFKPQYVKYALPLAIPIIFHTLSTVILSQSDRMMITALYNASETGIYSVAYNFGMISLVLTTSAENVWIPWFTQRMVDNEKSSVNKIARIYLMIISFVIVAIMFVSPDVLVFMAGEKYEAGVDFIPPVIIASFFIFLTSFSINLEYYYKKTSYIARNTVISGMVNIGLNVVFIPHFGGLAAAYTTVIAYMINFILHYFNSRKIDGELFPIRIYIIPIILILCGGVVYYFIKVMWVFRWFLGLGIGVYVLIKYRTELMSFVRRK